MFRSELLKGGSVGDHIGDYYRAYSVDTRGLDYSSWKPYTLLRV